jgi:hypothetical protein
MSTQSPAPPPHSSPAPSPHSPPLTLPSRLRANLPAPANPPTRPAARCGSSPTHPQRNKNLLRRATPSTLPNASQPTARIAIPALRFLLRFLPSTPLHCPCPLPAVHLHVELGRGAALGLQEDLRPVCWFVGWSGSARQVCKRAGRRVGSQVWQASEPGRRGPWWQWQRMRAGGRAGPGAKQGAWQLPNRRQHPPTAHVVRVIVSEPHDHDLDRGAAKLSVAPRAQ